MARTRDQLVQFDDVCRVSSSVKMATALYHCSCVTVKTTVETKAMRLTVTCLVISGSSSALGQEDAFHVDGLATGTMTAVMQATRVLRCARQRAVTLIRSLSASQRADVYHGLGFATLIRIAPMALTSLLDSVETARV